MERDRESVEQIPASAQHLDDSGRNGAIRSELARDEPPDVRLATGALTGEGSPLSQLAAGHGVSPAQLALAWLLKRSPVMLPIPGTSSISHLEDNIAGAAIELTAAEFDALSDAAK